MRVLIADADEALFALLQSFLWDRGHEAEFASDALKCLTMLREFVPDVLVLDRDLLWGGCDGVMAHMCEDPDLAAVPVILVANEDAPNIGGKLQVEELRKPYRLLDLLARINCICPPDNFIPSATVRCFA